MAANWRHIVFHVGVLIKFFAIKCFFLLFSFTIEISLNYLHLFCLIGFHLILYIFKCCWFMNKWQQRFFLQMRVQWIINLSLIIDYWMQNKNFGVFDALILRTTYFILQVCLIRVPLVGNTIESSVFRFYSVYI